MYKPESLIIDNTKLILFDELNKILKEQTFLDVASAYFNIAGFQLLKDSLSGAKKFRLLIGVPPQIDEKTPIFSSQKIFIDLYKKFREDLEDKLFKRDKKEAVVSLIELLKRDTWEVWLYDKGFLHGKAYIFDKLAIISSSNFT